MKHELCKAHTIEEILIVSTHSVDLLKPLEQIHVNSMHYLLQSDVFSLFSIINGIKICRGGGRVPRSANS